MVVGGLGGSFRGLFGLPGYASCGSLVTHICCVLGGARCTLGVLAVFGPVLCTVVV